MINPKELRIGNAVIDTEDGRKMTITLGAQIDRSDLLMPIPLTKERLEQIGMNNVGYLEGIGYLESAIEGWYVLDIEKYRVNDYPMTHLHHIQNMYYDFNRKELLIDLVGLT